MSRITDAIDGAGDTPIRLPQRHSGVLASNPARRERAELALRAGAGLAAAMLDALADLPSIEVVGFSAVDAEPFAVAAGAPPTVAAIVRERLARAGDIEGATDVVWAAHRGHVAFLHPGSLAASQIALALRLAEELDPARSLGRSSAELVRVVTSELTDAASLGECLVGDRLEALVASVGDAQQAAVAATPAIAEAVVLFAGDGSSVVARASGSASAFGWVDRGGRPWVLPLHGTDVAGFLTRLHRAIDLDAAPADILEAGVILDGDATPVLVGAEGTGALVAPEADVVEA